jgi:hypothetical protein
VTKLAAATLGLGLLSGTAPIFGHHSVHGTYLEDAPFAKVEGTVIQFLLRNPHSYGRVEDAAHVIWDIEWGNGGKLGQQGVCSGSLKAGDHVVVTGNQGRNPSGHWLYLRTIDRPSDGFHSKQDFTEWVIGAPAGPPCRP